MEDNTHELYPVGLTVVRPENPSKMLAAATLLFLVPKLLILIPHLIALYFLGIIALIIGAFAQFAVLFTGKYPEGAFKMVRGILQWQVRLNCYLFGLTDKYPPFSLD